MASRARVIGPRSRLFYVFAAVLIAAIIFAGFSGTFYLNSYFAKMHLAPVLLVHGFVFTSWIVLLIVQTSLATVQPLGNFRANPCELLSSLSLQGKPV